MKPLAFALLAGLASALGFAPLGLWPLTILAFAALLWLIETAPSLRSALARGWWFGVGQFVLGLNWIATAFTYQAAMPAWLGWVAVVLLSLYLAIYPAAAAGLAWRWGKGSATARALLLAAAWIVTEWLRASLFTGFAWNPVGVVLLRRRSPGSRSGIGTYGLVRARGADRRRVPAGLRPPRRRESGIGPAQRDRRARGPAPGRCAAQPPADAGPLVRIVQPEYRPGRTSGTRRLRARSISGGWRALSRAAAAGPRLLIWPEAAVTEPLEDGRRLIPLAPADVRATRRAVRRIRRCRPAAAAGSTFQSSDGRFADGATNSIYVLGRDGRILGRYDKAHLVPYGEYLPMRPLLSAIGLSRLAPGRPRFPTPGRGRARSSSAAVGRAGFQLCYEIIFSGQVVDRANRPDFIFNPSNDAWFGAWGPPQHLAQARLRAIEEGLPVIRATPTGISAVIDARAACCKACRSAPPARSTPGCPAAAPPTLFARFGNLLAFAFALLLVAAAIAVRRKAR